MEELYTERTEEFNTVRDMRYRVKANQLLEALPENCRAFYEYLSDGHTAKTRLDYLSDLTAFYEFLCNRFLDVPSQAEIMPDVLESLSAEMLESYVEYLTEYSKEGKKRTNSAAGIRRKLASLRAYIHFLQQSGVIMDAPTAFPVIREDSSETGRETILTGAQIETYFSTISNELAGARSQLLTYELNGTVNQKAQVRPHLIARDMAMAALMAFAGLKVSEVAALNTSDVDPAESAVYVQKSDGNKTRIIYNKQIKDALESYLLNDRAYLSPNAANHDALFLSNTHARISVRAIQKIIKKYSYLAFGMEDTITPHSLRLAFGAHYLKETGDIQATGKAMGLASDFLIKRYFPDTRPQSK